MEVKLLEVIGRHQILMLAVHKQISLREAASPVEVSLHHTKRLVKKLREVGQECRSSFKGGKTPATNPFIAEL